MRNSIWTGICTAIVASTTAAIFAQTTATPSPQPSSPSNAGRVTVTGCLKPAPGSAADTTAAATSGAATAATTGTAGATATAGTAGTAGQTAPSAAPAGETKYVLTDAVVSPADATPDPTTSTPTTTAPPPTAAPSTSAAPNANASSSTYLLVANPAALTPHVGKRLALTGTIEEQKGAPAPSETSGSTAPSMPSLRVESGKIVAESCSAK